MAREINIEKLIERFLNETDNSKIFKQFEKLLKLNAANPNPAIVEAFVKFLTLDRASHISPYIVARLGKLELNQIKDLEEDFRIGLQNDVLRYWSIPAYSKCADERCYPDLVAIALNEKLKAEERAHAIQCLASVSKKPFDRGMPKDPGHWNPNKFRLEEIIEWQNAGYAQGEGTKPPPRDPALDNPQTSFETTMAEFDLKLKKYRDADKNNATNPSNYLTYGNAESIEEVCEKWGLPSNYVDFLNRFFPYRLNCYPILKYDHDVDFCSPEHLIEEQASWSHYKDTGEPREFWRSEYFVFGNIDGPLMLDLSKSNGIDAPVLSYDYCLDLGECVKEAASFEAFIKKLKVKVR